MIANTVTPVELFLAVFLPAYMACDRTRFNRQAGRLLSVDPQAVDRRIRYIQSSGQVVMGHRLADAYLLALDAYCTDLPCLAASAAGSQEMAEAYAEGKGMEPREVRALAKTLLRFSKGFLQAFEDEAAPSRERSEREAQKVAA